jgi:two-component system NarL family sensor kinase
MTDWFLGASVATLAVATGVSGLVMLVVRRASVSGALLVIVALTGLAALVVHAQDGAYEVEWALAMGSTMLAFPVAVAAYPRWSWRRPIDFLAVTTLGAAGAISVSTSRDSSMSEAMSVVIASVLVVHVWWRLETADDASRVPLQWFAVSAVTVGLIGGFLLFAAEGAGSSNTPAAVVALMSATIGPAMAIGVVRPDVVDVRGLIVWGVVVCVAVIAYVSVFAGLISLLDWSGAPDLSPGALGLIGAVCALGFHPVVVMLRGIVDQMLFGDRPDPLQAATRVVDRIGDDPVLALRAIREALVLPYASLHAEGQTLATSGTEVTHTRTLPLRLGEDAVGEVVVGLRAGELMLPADDENVLRIVAPLLAQTLRATALARDLQESRGAAIAAIEDERRRLRRDLHDGLGPTLTGVAFSADAARNHLATDVDAADTLLSRLRADTADAISEVRRLVEGLRPATLDELGLVGAVRQHAATLHAAEGTPLEVTIDAPEVMPDLSAAAEVAAYRIVVESLTNVARHAAATKVQVRMSASDGQLHVSVHDDGASAKQWKPGVGLSSMRERAEQVGGSVVASARADGGRVDAVIPL